MAIDASTEDDDLVFIECESVPIPPGTKRKPLPRFDDPEPESRAAPQWWLVGAVAFAALVCGVVIGRLI